MILAVGWDQVPAAVKDLPDWHGRVVIDAANQWHSGPGTEVNLGNHTGSERNAALMPGARVVKAFNTVFASIVAVQSSIRADRPLVVFLPGDDANAKAAVSAFVDSLGFAPVDLGGQREGRLMQVGGGPLSGLHVAKIA